MTVASTACSTRPSARPGSTAGPRARRSPRKRGNVSFYRTAAAAQGAGYRACRRCLPDATPGSPGVGRRGRRRVPRDAAGGRRRGGARGRRRTRPGARLLDPPAQPRGHPAVRRRPARPRPVASCPDRPRADRDHRPLLRRRGLRRRLRAASASSTTRCARCTPPARRDLRSKAAKRAGWRISGTIHTRIAVREPFAADALHHFLAVHAVAASRPSGPAGTSARSGCPHGPGVVRVELGRPARPATSRAVHPGRRARPRARHRAHPPAARRRLRSGHGRRRRWPRTRSWRLWSTASPGLRVPGHLDGAEVAVQTVLGQQVSVAAARTSAARLVAARTASRSTSRATTR